MIGCDNGSVTTPVTLSTLSASVRFATPVTLATPVTCYTFLEVVLQCNQKRIYLSFFPFRLAKCSWSCLPVPCVLFFTLHSISIYRSIVKFLVPCSRLLSTRFRLQSHSLLRMVRVVPSFVRRNNRQTYCKIVFFPSKHPLTNNLQMLFTMARYTGFSMCNLKVEKQSFST